MAGQKALGRGLGALFPGGENQPAKAALLTLPIGEIRPNPAQPRKRIDPQQLESLADSIRQHGIIQPLVVRPAGEGYEIVAGERRWRAAGLAGLKEVPVRVLVMNESQSVQAALIENLQREDLTPLEVADGIRDLISRFAISHEEASRRLGWSRAAVTNKLRLLSLPDPVKAMLADRSLSEGHARALAGLEDPERVTKLAERIVRQGLSVRQAEDLVQKEKDRLPQLPAARKNQIRIPEDFAAFSREKGFKASLKRRPDGISLRLEGLSERQAEGLLELIRTGGDRVFLAEEE
jgi:ParB family chromosome partitioning protein